MKKILIALAMFLLFSTSSFAYSNNQEEITDFKSFININMDGSVDVTEEITVNALHQNINLGIFRDLPSRITIDGKNKKLKYKVSEVKRNDILENWWVEQKGGYLRILTGDSRSLKQGGRRIERGLHTYKISYTVNGLLNSYLDFDNLTMNVTGDYWIFPIKSSFAVVSMPDGIELKGGEGTYKNARHDNKKILTVVKGNKIAFKTNDIMAPEESYQIRINFSKGISIIEEKPTIFDNPLAITRWILIILFAYYMVVWSMYGKDEPLGTITPTFAPPKDLSVGKSAAIFYGRGYDKEKALTAAILSLAKDGFIKIKSSKYEEMSLIRTEKPLKEVKFQEERILLNALFDESGLDNVDVGRARKSFLFDILTSPSNLKEKAKKRIEEVVLSASIDRTKALGFKRYIELLDLFKDKLINTNGKFIFIGFLINLGLALMASVKVSFGFLLLYGLLLFYTPFFYAIFSGFRLKKFFSALPVGIFILFHFSIFMTFAPYSVFSETMSVDMSTFKFDYALMVALAILTYIVHIVFYHIMDKPSSEATRLIAELSGLKMFMEKVDKERFMKITPDIFETNLPYAVIFGLEDKWQKAFNLDNFGANLSFNEGFYDANSSVHISSSVGRMVGSSLSSLNSGGRGGFGGSGGGGCSGGGGSGGGGGGR